MSGSARQTSMASERRDRSGACAFCHPSTPILRAQDTALAFADAFPVSPGHTLVVPTRHVASLFELAPDEWDAVWRLVAEVRRDLAAAGGIDGFNIGVNDGAAAGQTVGHAHVHIIPRRMGDVPDPRGGIRAVIPERTAWWADDAPA